MRTTIGQFARPRTSTEEEYNVMLISIIDKLQDDGEYLYKGLNGKIMKLVKTTPARLVGAITGAFFFKSRVEQTEVDIQMTDAQDIGDPRTVFRLGNSRDGIPYKSILAV